MKDSKLQIIEEFELQRIDPATEETRVQVNGLSDRPLLRAAGAILIAGAALVGVNALQKGEEQEIKRPSIELETPERPSEAIREKAELYIASPPRNELVTEYVSVHNEKILDYVNDNYAANAVFYPLKDAADKNIDSLGHIRVSLPGTASHGALYATVLVRKEADGNYLTDKDFVDLFITDGDTQIFIQSDSYYSAIATIPNKPDGSWHLTLSTLTPERYVENVSASRNAIYMQSADDLNEVDSKVLDLLAQYTDSLDS